MKNGMVVGWNTLKKIEERLTTESNTQLENKKTVVEQYVNMSLQMQVNYTSCQKWQLYLRKI